MSNLNSFSIIGGGSKENRKANDFYPTPENVTIALMEFLHSEVSFFFDQPLSIWEPACGEGHMSEVIKRYGHNVHSTDLRHTNYLGDNINYAVDFLNFPSMPDKFDAIITNPPFNLSEEFIFKSVRESKIVCMLLKSQYWHAKKRKQLFDMHTPKYVLPLTWRPDFDGRGAPTMDLAWTVWIRGWGARYCSYMPLEKPSLLF